MTLLFFLTGYPDPVGRMVTDLSKYVQADEDLILYMWELLDGAENY